MQTSKFLVATGAAVALILPLQISAAPDSPEQAQMRAALRQKMEQLDAAAPKPAAVTPPPAAPVPKPQPQPQPVPAPVAPPPPAAPAAPEIVMFEKPSNVPPADDAEAAKAREAVRQKIAAMQTGAPQATVSAPAPAPAAPATPVVTTSAPVVEKQMPAVPPPVNDAALAGAETAVRNKLSELNAAPAPKAAAAPESRPITAVTAAAEYAPIQPPASPLSAAKQARLADLLSRYKADTITALEYHTQRAAILAEP